MSNWALIIYCGLITYLTRFSMIALIKKEMFNIVIQINGKKRSLITSKIDLEEGELIKEIYNINELKKFVENKKIIKTIFIKNKLINLIIK